MGMPRAAGAMVLAVGVVVERAEGHYVQATTVGVWVGAGTVAEGCGAPASLEVVAKVMAPARVEVVAKAMAAAVTVGRR